MNVSHAKGRRVLVVHSSADLYGADRSLLDFVRLRPPDLDLTIVLPEDGPLIAELRATGVDVLVGEVCKIQRRMLSLGGLLHTVSAAIRSVRFLRGLHRQRNFELVYSNSVAILGGALAARSLHLPHVWHVREILSQSAALTWTFQNIVRALSARAICNSAQTMAWIRGSSPSKAEHFAVIWNGYDAPAMDNDRVAVRKTLGASKDEVLFVLVGRVNAWKGQRQLVDSFRDLVQRADVRARLALVGSAFAGQEHFERELRSAIAASGCADRIGWFPFRPDIEAVWAAADVAVVPSIEPEPFGRVAVEAMAFGKPVIAAAHGGLIEIVEHEVTGLLFKPCDRAALSGAMDRLARQPELRERFGRAGMQRQQALFSVRGYADRVGVQLAAVMRDAGKQARR